MECVEIYCVDGKYHFKLLINFSMFNLEFKMTSWMTNIAIAIFVAYIAKSLHFFYELFVYQQCSPMDDPIYCLRVS